MCLRYIGRLWIYLNCVESVEMFLTGLPYVEISVTSVGRVWMCLYCFGFVSLFEIVCQCVDLNFVDEVWVIVPHVRSQWSCLACGRFLGTCLVRSGSVWSCLVCVGSL